MSPIFVFISTMFMFAFEIYATALATHADPYATDNIAHNILNMFVHTADTIGTNVIALTDMHAACDSPY